MARTTLNADARTETGKGISRRLRADGRVPAVLYGKGTEPKALSVLPKDVFKILETGQGQNTPIDLQVDGEKGTHLTIIKDLQIHPWRRTIKHVDFWEIAEDGMITLSVPLRRVGKSELELLGGQVQMVRKSMKVRCTPAHIPATIDYDMTSLPENNLVMASEITMPEGVQSTFKNDFKVLHVKVPKGLPEEDGEEGGEEDGDAVAEA
jgi:large subunit ribosomal protein L25